MCANLAACSGNSHSFSLRERAGASRCGSRSACALLDSVKKGGFSPACGLQDRAPRSRFQSLLLDFPTLTLTLSRQRAREKEADFCKLALMPVRGRAWVAAVQVRTFENQRGYADPHPHLPPEGEGARQNPTRYQFSSCLRPSLLALKPISLINNRRQALVRLRHPARQRGVGREEAGWLAELNLGAGVLAAQADTDRQTAAHVA